MDGAVHTFKSRLVAKGFTQTYGVDYEETFSPVVDIRAIRILIAIAAWCLDTSWKKGKRSAMVPYASAVGSIMYAVRCTRPDVAFAQNITSRFQQNPGELHWTTIKNILKYLRNTKVMFLVYGDAEYVVAFDASKEAVWIRKFIFGLNVVPTIEEPITMYCDNTRVIAITNDHGVTKGKCECLLDVSIASMNADCYTNSQVGAVGKIDNGKSVKMPLGGHFKLSLKNFPVRDCDVERMSKVPYANAVRSLMYLMVCMRLDIAYGGCVVSWKATLQHVVALSTTEAEYMALTEAMKEAIWLRGLLEELGVELNTVAVNCNNQGVIHLSQNHVFPERTKHINVRYHFIKEVLEAKTVKVLKVGTEHNVVDALTKVVLGRKLQHCLELLKVGVG
ncbi:retrovirus-related pol polyprotein from transposon TNT 1-94 [Tanacetum coccineum]